MARRRPPADLEPDLPVPPPELLRCEVEDWVAPFERPEPWWFSGSGADLPGALFWRYVMLARRRWRDARHAWGDEHGLDRSELAELVPPRRPQFRDSSAYDLVGPVGRATDASRKADRWRPN